MQRGVCYYDGQFDDERLAVNLAQTIFDLGGTAVNYMQVVSLIKHGELLAGAVVRDMESGEEYEVHAKAVVNATGVFPMESADWTGPRPGPCWRRAKARIWFC